MKPSARIPLALLLAAAGSLTLPVPEHAMPAASPSAGPVQQATIPGLRAAIEARIVRLAPDSRERVALERTLEPLGAYTGSLSSYSALDRSDPAQMKRMKLDLFRLRDVAGYVQDSQTPVEGIHVQMGAVHATLVNFGGEARQVAKGLLPLLTGAAGREAIEQRIGRGDELNRDGLRRFLRRRYEGGTKRLVQAIGQFVGAEIEGVQQRFDEARLNPVDLRPMEVTLPAQPPVSMVPFTVSGLVELTNPAPELTVAVRAIPAADAETSKGIDPQITLGSQTLRDIQAGTIGVNVPVQIPPFAEESSKTVLLEGAAVDVDGDLAVIGRPNVRTARTAGTESGMESWVTVLGRNAGGFEEWNEIARLDIGPGDNLFGNSVAVSGNTVVVGAPGIATDRGAVYVYTREGDDFLGPVMLQASDGASRDFFGASVAIDGEWLVVGAPDHQTGVGQPFPGLPAHPRRGTAYVFRRSAQDPLVWNQVADLTHFPDAISDIENAYRPLVCGAPVFADNAVAHPGLESFGQSVAIDGDLIVIGDPRCTVEYEFFDSPIDPDFSCREYDGDSVRTGAAFVWRRVGNSWQYLPYSNGGLTYERPAGWLLPENQVADIGRGDLFASMGFSVAVADGTVVVGAPTVDGDRLERLEGIPTTGGAFVFTRSSGFQLTKILHAPGPASGDRFGHSVDISHHGKAEDPRQTILVGSPFHDHPQGPVDAGSVYVFVRGHEPNCVPSPGGWGLLARKVSEAPTLGGGVGGAVAVASPTGTTDEDGVFEQDFRTTFAVTGFGEDADGSVVHGVRLFSGMEPVLSGEYWIAFDIDPFNRILEFEDSDPNANLMRTGTTVSFCVPALDQLDLAVDTVELVPIELGKGSITIVREEIPDGSLGPPRQGAKAGLNVTGRMAGMFDGPLSGARLSATATAGGITVDLGIWDEGTKAYENEVRLPTLSSGDPFALQLDVAIPEDDLPSLPSMEGGYSLDVSVMVRPPPGVNDVVASNDEFTLGGQVLRVIHFRTCNFTENFEKQLGNDDFNVTVDFDSALGIYAVPPSPPHGIFPDNLAQRGAIGGVTGGGSLTLFGRDLGRLGDFRALAERDPTYVYDPVLYPGMDPGYFFMGFDLRVIVPFGGFGLETVYAVGPYDTFDLGTLNIRAPDGVTVDLAGGGIGLSKEFSIAKGLEEEKVFYPGGVPVTVTGRVQGRLGFTAGLSVVNAVRVDLSPFLDFGAGASFAVGDCRFLCVGAEGEIDLLDDTLDVTAALGLQVTPASWLDDPDPNADHSLGANACFAVSNTVTLLSGRLKVFAVYPWIEWCSWLGIPYPCGIYLRKSEFPIVDWIGLRTTQGLVDLATNLCCTPVVGTLQCDNSGLLCR